MTRLFKEELHVPANLFSCECLRLSGDDYPSMCLFFNKERFSFFHSRCHCVGVCAYYVFRPCVFCWIWMAQPSLVITYIPRVRRQTEPRDDTADPAISLSPAVNSDLARHGPHIPLLWVSRSTQLQTYSEIISTDVAPEPSEQFVALIHL